MHLFKSLRIIINLFAVKINRLIQLKSLNKIGLEIFNKLKHWKKLCVQRNDKQNTELHMK